MYMYVYTKVKGVTAVCVDLPELDFKIATLGTDKRVVIASWSLVQANCPSIYSTSWAGFAAHNELCDTTAILLLVANLL